MTISIALPTGAMLSSSLDLLRRAGIADLDANRLGRRLLLEEEGLRMVLVRPADVPAYVDYGAVDLGVVGKDSLWESTGSHHELVDLRFGACTMVMAVPEDSGLAGPETWPVQIRVATKYPLTTARYMDGLGHAVEIFRLHGSVELAPLVRLTDAIVDLTATGNTLKANRLQIVAELGHSTARLIANQASMKTRGDALQSVVSRIKEAVSDRY